MHLYKLFLLIFILLSGSISTSSYANLVYQDSTTANASCPVDKNNPVKKKKSDFERNLGKRLYLRLLKK
jgi:hypothetical protein